MKQFNEIINEASERLSKDFAVGESSLSKQTKTWLKELDAAMERYKLTYDKCREAARQFKHGNFEGALKTIWGKKLEVETTNSENGGNIKTVIYTVPGYAVWTEKIEYKSNFFVHSITGTYDEFPTPGYSLATVVSVSGKGDTSELELIDNRVTSVALSKRNTANIYNILFVGKDIPSKLISKPMLKLKNPL
jgi:hypothetical protein